MKEEPTNLELSYRIRQLRAIALNGRYIEHKDGIIDWNSVEHRVNTARTNGDTDGNNNEYTDEYLEARKTINKLKEYLKGRENE